MIVPLVSVHSRPICKYPKCALHPDKNGQTSSRAKVEIVFTFSYSCKHRFFEYLLIVLMMYAICIYKRKTRCRAHFAALNCLKEYYEIVGESRPLSAFFPKHADFFTKMHF